MGHEKITELIAHNVDLMRQAITVMARTPAGLYSCNNHELFTGGVGMHFRHVFGFYEQFLGRSGAEVDYDARSRDVRVEKRPEAGIDVARKIVAGLESLGLEESLQSELAVKTEIATADGDRVSVRSTLPRELSFLAGHTIHHFAMIAMIFRIEGMDVPEGFGVAPSTLRHTARLDRD